MIHVYVYTMVPARCVLDVWILSLALWVLLSLCALQTFDFMFPSPLFDVCGVIPTLLLNSVCQNPCNAGMV